MQQRYFYDDGSEMRQDGDAFSSVEAPIGNLLSDIWNPTRTGFAKANKVYAEGGSNWESWIQSAATGLMGAYGQSQTQKNQLELAKLQLQQRGSNGEMYQEGQPSGGGGGLQLGGNTLLILGAAAVLFFVMKD
jgi:hypothetical protein